MLKLLLLLTLTACPTLASAQEIPEGVNYNRASDQVNSEAKAALERALAEPKAPTPPFTTRTIVVGPMLWRAISGSAPKALHEAPPLIVIVPTPEPVTADGRRMLTDNHRRLFWSELWKFAPDLKGATIRKANSPEISYYWSTIPFDIEEPFFTIDTGKRSLVVNVIPTDKEPGILWIDLVGDTRTLKK